MIANNVILIFLIFDFNLKSLNSDSSNSLIRKKRVIDLYDGSGNDQENITESINQRLVTPDDEDSSRNINTNVIHSSGYGPPEPPNVYPSLDPYTKSISTASILVDFATKAEYKSYMLPGSRSKMKLKEFHDLIIKNLKEELNSLNLDLDYKILSLRPGPLIPKNFNTKEPESPSVFVRVNIIQINSSIVNPLIIFHISHCGRLRNLGNLTISDQIIFPQYVCLPNQVYCLPDCMNGSYCDGISDCPNSDLDESPSCPKCLHKNLKLTANSDYLNEGENLALLCEFKESCRYLQNKMQWRFPAPLKDYEKLFKGHMSVNSLPRAGIVSGLYKCYLDGDFVSKNITVIPRPEVVITNSNADAETILITEFEGSSMELWCNTTNGHVHWFSIESSLGTVIQLDEKHSKISLKNIGGAINLQCQVRWGFEERGHIIKTVRLNVVCNLKRQFQCKKPSGKMCIPLEQKCDTIAQCEDGSDEVECTYCTEKSLSIDSGSNILKDVGDTLIMTCLSSQESCSPLKWIRSNKPLVSSGNVVVYRQTVFILNISTEHAGLYRCAGSSNSAHTDVSVFLNEPPILTVNPSTSVINVTYGGSQEAECSVLSSKGEVDPNLSPRWIPNIGKMATDNVQIKSGSNRNSILNISKATKEIEGEYTCEVEWGLRKSRKISVSVMIKVTPLVCQDAEKMCTDKMSCIPESKWCDGHKHCQDGSDEESCNKCRNGFVFVQPSSIVMLSKDTSQITCYYHKDCYPVEWRVLNNRVPLSSISGVSVMDNKLIFNNVGLDASNVYECFSGEKASQTNVTVINEVEITFLDNPAYVFADYESDIEVNCQSNYGQPVWRKRESKSIEEVSGASQTYVKPNIARLTIKSASYDARGYYNCSVRLPGSNKDVARKLMFIHVYDLECPENFIKCDKNTKCIPKNKICDKIHDCTDNEDEKNCSKCQYDLDIKPKSMVLSTRGWGSFTCNVLHKDCLPIEWQTKAGEISSHNGFYKYNVSLFIFNSVPRTNEEIMCTNGQKMASAYLTVKNLELSIIPNIPEDTTLYVKKGETKIVECRSSLGNPQWIFPKEDMFHDLGIRYITQSNIAILQMENVKERVSGLYICSVTFSRENKKKTISVKVI